MKKLLLSLTVVLASCGTTYPGASYIAADEETYTYAQPKLEEWAEMKGDEDWKLIVKNKGISWRARIERAKKREGETSE